MKGLWLLGAMLFAPLALSQEHVTSPSVVYAGAGAYFNDGDEPCQIIADQLNADPMHPTTYSNARYGTHPDYGVGCYYDELHKVSGEETLGQFRQNYVVPKLVCPAGYAYYKNEVACIRFASVVLANKPSRNCVSVGNPIFCDSRIKVEYAQDMLTAAYSLKRVYRSVTPFENLLRSVHGGGWHSDITRRLVFSSPTAPHGETAYAIRGDGAVVTFVKNAAGQWDTEADLLDYELTASGAGWVLRLSNNRHEVYDQRGDVVEDVVDGVTHATFLRDGVGRVEKIVDATGRQVGLEYGTSGLLSEARLPIGEVVTYSYDSAHMLVRVDKHGSYTNYGYTTFPWSTSHYLESVSHDGSVYAEFSYADYGNATLSGHSGGADRYEVRYPGELSTEVQYPSGSVKEVDFQVALGVRVPVETVTRAPGLPELRKTTAYDANLNAVSERVGPVLTCRYFSDGRFLAAEFKFQSSLPNCPATVSEATGSGYISGWQRVVAEEWDKPVSMSEYDSSGVVRRAREWTYNTRGQTVSITQLEPATGTSRSTTTTYCEQTDIDAGTCPQLGLMTLVDGPRTDVNDVTTYTHYPTDHADCATSPTTCHYRRGDLWKVTNALGHVTETLRYDGAGRPLSIKDANGVVTDMEYHPRGWLTARKVRGPDAGSETDDAITRIDYHPTGLISSTTLPDGSFTSYVYDAAHRLTDIVDADGNRLHYTLDNAGNRTQEDVLGETGTLMRTLSRVYNQLGQLQTQKDAGNQPTAFTYDAAGNTDIVTDALGHVTDNDYDPLNRLVKTLQDVGGIEAETRFEYDALDNLTAVIDPKGLTTGYTYNAFGDLTRLESPDTGITTYTYDNAGNRARQVDARGDSAEYLYGPLNRLTGIAYDGAVLTPDVSYVYDTAQPGCDAGETFAIGRLSRIDDGSGSTRYCYDRFGQLTRKVQVTNNRSFTLRYAYTKAGQLSRMTYPDGTEVDYVRDGLGRTTEVGVTASGGSREVLLTNATWYPFGPVGAWTFGNGRTMARTLDQDYRPQSILSTGTGAGGLDLGYSWDAVGNLARMHTADRAEPPRITLDYDTLNRLTHFRDGPTGTAIETYSYDATGNRTGFANAAGPEAYSYPADSHHLTAVGATARGYDAAGNTASIGGTAQAFAYNAAGRMTETKRNNVVAMQYAYNGRGEQVRRYLGATSTYTVYDEAGHWIGDYDSTGAAIQQVIWLDDLPVGVIAGNQLHYVEPDHLGTPRAVIDPQRDVAVWTWNLASEAFGNSTPNEDPDGDSTQFVFDMRFPGQRYDAASGVNQNGFRDYEAATGRYPTSDPVGHLGGINTYAYAASNPLMWFDPDGLQAQPKPNPPQPPSTNPPGRFTPPNLPPANDPVYGPRRGPGPGPGGALGACLNPIVAGIVLMAIPGNIDQPWRNCSDDPRRERPECGNDDDDFCEKRFQIELQTCRGLGVAERAGRAPKGSASRCYESAQARLWACQNGRPEPPLHGWPQY